MHNNNIKPDIFSGILIASDIDGTFLDSSGHIVKRNLAAINRFKMGGGRFLFATGRSNRGLDKFVPGYQDIMNSPGIFNNGACVYDPSSGGTLHKICLDPDFTYEVMNLIKRKFPDVDVRCTCGDKLICYDENLDSDLPKGDCYRIIVYGIASGLEGVRELIDRIYPSRFSITKSCEVLLELLDSSATKGTMLEWLKGWYAEKGEKLYFWAVGDHENDLDMLKKADASACPSNAHPMILDACHKIVGTNDGGAVADLIEYIESEIINI